MYSGYVLYIIDTETTGMIPEEHDIIEISACRILLDKDEPTREQKTWLLKAINPRSIEDDALRVNGHKREDITHMSKFGKENYKEPADVVSEIELWMMEDSVSAIDRIFIGQNPKFDIDMMKALWKKVGSKDTFPFVLENDNRVIDTKQIATLWDICTGRRRRYYNLSSLVKSFGVKKGKAHKAEEDVRMTADLFIKLINPVQEVVKTAFNDCYIEVESD